MAATNMNSLTTLIKRLEAATSRLEDMAQATLNPAESANGISPSTATTGASSSGGTGDATAASLQPVESLPPSVQAFDELIASDVKKYAGLSDELGGVVAEQSSAVFRAFEAQRKILIVATKAKKPDVQSPLYMEILTELQRHMGRVGDIRETNRASPLFNHLSAVSEGITALGWITVEPKPADCIQEAFSGAQFFGNRVLKDYKEKDRKHVEWVQALYQIFKSLIAYVKQHYANGLAWNKEGVDAREALQQLDSVKNITGIPVINAPKAGGVAAPPPPPPPPPPLPSFDAKPPSGKGGTAGDMDAVFAQLNQGEAVTTGLRKVDKSEMTHKNPSLRAGGTVPTRSGSQTSVSSASRGKSPVPPGKKPKPESMRTKKPPRKELDGNKWFIENYESEHEPIQISAQINQSIIVSRCRHITLQVTGKANAISIDNSPRVSLILDSLVSSVDVIKSSSFALQVLGSLPTILLDQVDGATIYLGAQSLGTEIFTSKCSNVNINVPGSSSANGASSGNVGDDEGDDDDYVECPIPEQIKSFVRNGGIFSEIVEHAG